MKRKDIYVVFECRGKGESAYLHLEAVYSSRKKAKAHKKYFERVYPDREYALCDRDMDLVDFTKCL